MAPFRSESFSRDVGGGGSGVGVLFWHLSTVKKFYEELIEHKKQAKIFQSWFSSKVHFNVHMYIKTQRFTYLFEMQTFTVLRERMEQNQKGMKT